MGVSRTVIYRVARRRSFGMSQRIKFVNVGAYKRGARQIRDRAFTELEDGVYLNIGDIRNWYNESRDGLVIKP